MQHGGRIPAIHAPAVRHERLTLGVGHQALFLPFSSQRLSYLNDDLPFSTCVNRYLRDRRVNGEKRTASDGPTDNQPVTTKRPRGRPKGSKNRGGKAGGNAASGSASTSGSAVTAGAA